MAKSLKGTIKEILGTAVSVGCTVNKIHPKELQEKIQSGQTPSPAPHHDATQKHCSPPHAAPHTTARLHCGYDEPSLSTPLLHHHFDTGCRVSCFLVSHG